MPLLGVLETPPPSPFPSLPHPLYYINIAKCTAPCTHIWHCSLVLIITNLQMYQHENYICKSIPNKLSLTDVPVMVKLAVKYCTQVKSACKVVLSSDTLLLAVVTIVPRVHLALCNVLPNNVPMQSSALTCRQEGLVIHNYNLPILN